MTTITDKSFLFFELVDQDFHKAAATTPGIYDSAGY